MQSPCRHAGTHEPPWPLLCEPMTFCPWLNWLPSTAIRPGTLTFCPKSFPAVWFVSGS